MQSAVLGTEPQWTKITWCTDRVQQAYWKHKSLLHLSDSFVFEFKHQFCSCMHQRIDVLFCISLKIAIQTLQNSIKKILLFCFTSSTGSWSWHLSTILAIFLLVKVRIFCRKRSITCHLFQPWRRNRKLTATTQKMKNITNLPQNKDVLFNDFRLSYIRST